MYGMCHGKHSRNLLFSPNLSYHSCNDIAVVQVGVCMYGACMRNSAESWSLTIQQTDVFFPV